jgi:hypothetical protein
MIRDDIETVANLIGRGRVNRITIEAKTEEAQRDLAQVYENIIYLLDRKPRPALVVPITAGRR